MSIIHVWATPELPTVTTESFRTIWLKPDDPTIVRLIDVHVWVDETRPRNQGSQLTTWELAENGVPHTLNVDNAGGHLMQHGDKPLTVRTTAPGTTISNYAFDVRRRDW